MAEWVTIVLLLLSLIFMAFFAGIEMAYYSANRLQIEIKKKQEGVTAKLLHKFLSAPAKFIGTTLIGYTLFFVLFGLQTGNLMLSLGRDWHIASAGLLLVIEIILATFFILIFADLIPRAFFRANSNSWLEKLSPVTNFFYQIFYPLANGCILLASWILKYIFNIRLDKNKEPITRSDLKHLFQMTEEDERQERNTQLMENAQELPNIKIRQCLVPRKEIVGIEAGATMEELTQKFITTKLSKLIVYKENIDQIIGYVHQLAMFKKPTDIQSILLPIPAVPESMTATSLINKFTRNRKSIAWVVDEFGGTAGIITLEDVLEELFGEIQDEYDTEEFIDKQIAANEFMFSGRLELDFLSEKYGFEFDTDTSETLSGYIINHHEKIPSNKERIIIDDFEFDILHVSDTRIEMVKMKWLNQKNKS
ncbi:MAG: hemolysin family protein [Chitinophagaceae bacterium]|nr:HlyC/CorC family transporter [Chitinophagaceae bacterium]